MRTAMVLPSVFPGPLCCGLLLHDNTRCCCHRAAFHPLHCGSRAAVFYTGDGTRLRVRFDSISESLGHSPSIRFRLSSPLRGGISLSETRLATAIGCGYTATWIRRHIHPPLCRAAACSVPRAKRLPPSLPFSALRSSFPSLP